MANNSAIEWTEATWNPLAGCSAVSPGCQRCYAATMARRLEAMGQKKYAGTAERRGSVDVFTGRINLDEAALTIPLRWKKPRRIFVNSMSDLFHESVPEAFIDRCFGAMHAADWNTYQVLTKRPQRMMEYVTTPGRSKMVMAAGRELARGHGRDILNNAGVICWPLPSVWLGTSVEDQQRADERIPWLLKTPAAVRFLSCEPLLSAIDLARFLSPEVHHHPDHDLSDPTAADAINSVVMAVAKKSGWHGIDWVIVGGESGRDARPMHPEWARGLRDQCTAAGVPFFFKQWGEHLAFGNNSPCLRWDSQQEDGGSVQILSGAVVDGRKYGGNAVQCDPDDKISYVRVGKHAAGRQIDGRTWDEFPT